MGTMDMKHLYCKSELKVDEEQHLSLKRYRIVKKKCCPTTSRNMQSSQRDNAQILQKLKTH